MCSSSGCRELLPDIWQCEGSRPGARRVTVVRIVGSLAADGLARMEEVEAEICLGAEMIGALL